MINLTEAFQALDLLNEEAFDMDVEGAKKAREFENEIVDDEVIDIIDTEAEEEEDLEDSYIGKVVLSCRSCQAKLYKNPEDVVIDEESEDANIEDICPNCQAQQGFDIIGQIEPFKNIDDEEDIEVEADDDVDIDIEELDDEEESEDEEKSEGEKESDDEEKSEEDEDLNEDLNNVSIETDNEKITVTSEPKEDEEVEDDTEEETIAPISPETEEKFNSDEDNVEDNVEDRFIDIDIDELDEDEFDELGENYLKRVYENVRSYKTTSCKLSDDKLKLEGIITFKSGNKVKTNFIFESKSVSKTGRLKFLGENKQFARGNKSFTLTGRLNNGKLIAESLSYNYFGKDANTNKSQRVYGTVFKR